MGRPTLKSFFALISLSALGLTACLSEEDIVSISSSGSSGPSIEFKYNYQLLKYLYIHQDEYLEAPEKYIGKLDLYSLSNYQIPLEYYDIYYMYAKMNDDYTYYLDPSRSSKAIYSLKYSDQRLDPGFEWDKTDSTNQYIVTSVITNSPAYKAGLKEGDIITAIEGVAPTSDVVFERLSLATEGDTINYTIQRDSSSKNISLILEPYLSPTVKLSFEDSIPVIKILDFVPTTSSDSGTYGEFMAFMHQTEKYKSLIVDLRDNGGGDGDQCFAISQEFLSRGDSTMGFISTRGDTIQNIQVFDTTFYINDVDGIAKDRYVVFLANGFSASCSEVLLGSVVQNTKSPIVGNITYGKGIGQFYRSTPSYGLARITASRIIDKDFKTYHKYGFNPDFFIVDDNVALKKAVELAKEGSYVRQAGYGTSNTGHFAKSAEVKDTMPGFYMLPSDMKKHSFVKGITKNAP